VPKFRAFVAQSRDKLTAIGLFVSPIRLTGEFLALGKSSIQETPMKPLPGKINRAQHTGSARKSIFELFTLWRDSEAELASIAYDLGQCGSDDAAEMSRIERREDQLNEIQNAAILMLLEAQSQSISDVICKLKVWREMTAPIAGLDRDRSPLEQLALNAVDELSEMGKIPGEQ